MKIKLNTIDTQLFKLPVGETIMVFGHMCTMTEEHGLVAEVDPDLAKIEIDSGRFLPVVEQFVPVADTAAGEEFSKEDLEYVTNVQRTRKELVDFAYRRCNGFVVPANMNKEQIVETILRFFNK